MTHPELVIFKTQKQDVVNEWDMTWSCLSTGYRWGKELMHVIRGAQLTHSDYRLLPRHTARIGLSADPLLCPGIPARTENHEVTHCRSWCVSPCVALLKPSPSLPVSDWSRWTSSSWSGYTKKWTSSRSSPKPTHWLQRSACSSRSRFVCAHHMWPDVKEVRLFSENRFGELNWRSLLQSEDQDRFQKKWISDQTVIGRYMIWR